MIFHISATRFNDSMGHDKSVTIMFIQYETIVACFDTARLLHNFTTWLVSVGQI